MADQEIPATNPESEAIADNKVVSFHYRLAEVMPDGTRSEWMEESHDAQPLLYLHGFHNVITGLEKALAGKRVGDAIEITLTPDEAYGQRDPKAIQRVPIKHLHFPGNSKLQRGALAVVQTKHGRRNVIVVKPGKFNADVDFNHPLAGRTLFYAVEVVAIRDATEEEIAHGHVHGVGGHHH